MPITFTSIHYPDLNRCTNSYLIRVLNFGEYKHCTTLLLKLLNRWPNKMAFTSVAGERFILIFGLLQAC